MQENGSDQRNAHFFILDSEAVRNRGTVLHIVNPQAESSKKPQIMQPPPRAHVMDDGFNLGLEQETEMRLHRGEAQTLTQAPSGTCIKWRECIVDMRPCGDRAYFRPVL